MSTPATDAFKSLPPAIRSRLAAEGVRSLDDWRSLGPRRHQLFGLTSTMVKTVDAIAKAARARPETRPPA